MRPCHAGLPLASSLAMMKRMKIAAVLGLLTLATGPALAGKKGGVSMPDKITVDGKSLVLNGMGVREATVFDVDVYVAGLYLEKASQDGNAILGSPETKRLHMQFVRDVDQDDMVEAISDGFKKSAGGGLAALKPRIKMLSSWLPELEEGNTITMTYLPGRGVQVSINGKDKGTIEGDDFAKALFGIWLGSSPPNGGLKKGLLHR
jgi:hypothetical protein